MLRFCIYIYIYIYNLVFLFVIQNTVLNNYEEHITSKERNGIRWRERLKEKFNGEDKIKSS